MLERTIPVCTFVYSNIPMQKERDKHTHIRLGELHSFLNAEAHADQRSLHFWILKILREYRDAKMKQRPSIGKKNNDKNVYDSN